MVELSSDMIYTTTPAGIIEYVNPACRDLLDLEAIDIIGRPIVDFVSESMRESFKDRLEELRRGDVQRIAVEVPMVGAKQSHVLTEQTISATRTDDGGRERLVGYQAIVRDITRHEGCRSRSPTSPTTTRSPICSAAAGSRASWTPSSGD